MKILKVEQSSHLWKLTNDVLLVTSHILRVIQCLWAPKEIAIQKSGHRKSEAMI